jgi:GeoRSP system SPASM domain protein
MNIRELKTPIRIYWDLAPQTQLDHRQIAEQIAGLKILSLDLTETAPAVSGACLAILERLKTEQIAVSLTLPLVAATPAALLQLSRFRLKTVSIGIAGAHELPAVQLLRYAASEAGAGAGLQVGVSCQVTSHNYRDLPALLAFCVEQGAPLVLPMQRMELGGDCFGLERGERQELSRRLSEINRPEKMRITIHDPFLWRVFFPTTAFPEGSCQAANTMLHIAANGEVYPCASLPVRLGSLAETTLSAIATSVEKRELRERLISPPQGCLACDELASCLGGCRGRGYCTTDSWEEPDPGCL